MLAGREKRQKMAELFGAPQRARVRANAAGTPHYKQQHAQSADLHVRTSMDEAENRLADDRAYHTPKSLLLNQRDADTTDESDVEPLRPTTPHFVS